MTLEITYLGHSAFLFGDGTQRVAVDPWLTGNPVAKHQAADIQVGHVILTHGHEDHFGDTIEIAKNNDATVIAPYEASVYADSQGCQTIGANPGGKVVTDWGWAAYTNAIHSSSYQGNYMGACCGVVLNMGGVTVYHCGDTDIFSDMKMYGEIYKPDIVCIPIGDLFTMGPELATRAAEWIGAKVAIPIHYKTFPLLVQDASNFKPQGVEVKVMDPGDTWSYG